MATCSPSSNAPAGVDAAGNPITYDAINVADGLPETAWRVSGNGQGEWIHLEFADPIRVSAINIIPGYTKIDPYDNTDRFWQNRRVARARIEFSDGTGVDVQFRDDPNYQEVRLSTPVVTNYIQLIIVQSTEPGTDQSRDFTPISEIQILGEVPLP